MADTQTQRTRRTQTDRQTARQAATQRRVERDAERAEALRAGWQHATTENVRLVTDAAHAVALRFKLDTGRLDADVLDAVLTYIGRHADRVLTTQTQTHRDRETGEHYTVEVPQTVADAFKGSTSTSSYAAKLARRIALQKSRRMATGGGSMRRLTVSEEEVADRVRRTYGSAAFTVRSGTTVRTLSEAESDALFRTQTFERTEAAPAYARWFDGRGQSVPQSQTGHQAAQAAQNVPHIHADALRRGTLAERIGQYADDKTLRAILAVFDQAAPGQTRTPWQRIADATHQDRTGQSTARAARKAVADWWTDEVAQTCHCATVRPVYVPPVRPSAQRLTVTVPVRSAGYMRYRTHPGTGERIATGGTFWGTSTSTSTSTSAPVLTTYAPWQWEEVGTHQTDCDTDTDTGHCVPGCDALRLVSKRGPVYVPDTRTVLRTGWKRKDAAHADADAARDALARTRAAQRMPYGTVPARDALPALVPPVAGPNAPVTHFPRPVRRVLPNAYAVRAL